MFSRLTPGLLSGGRPRALPGVAVAVVAVAAATLVIYALKSLAPTLSLGVVYLPAVLVVSAYWGFLLGILTSLLSAAAFNYFHLPPIGRLSLSDHRDWVALAAFVTVSAVVSAMAELARSREMEAERRRGEADLAAALARELLAGSDTRTALGATARRVAEALAISSAAIELGAADGDERRVALALRGGDGAQIASLMVPRGLPPEVAERLRTQVVPALGALVAIALSRDAMQAEAVETAALRRSDDVKTALLRAVSHDLRSPLTAIVAGGHALGASSLTEEERRELSAAVVGEGTRLSALVDKLLDLSKLQAGSAEPRRDWISVEDVLLTARDGLGDRSAEIRLSIDPDVPALRADGAQLERAFANVLENARRYSDGLPVSVHARRMGSQVVVRIVDQGPGIPAAERERIFEPFYRSRGPGPRPWTGSGLGLAIARGFVEANGGTISVESLPGQGTSFVIALPMETSIEKARA
ncbi:MAG TPA: ATP-binding protein [Solirubrobacteraceae bacterium]|jgi:two-component system sensor histidine kinase KdpD|nr:ATP-binding protein [Solirubrobacteraceae bacterium]